MPEPTTLFECPICGSNAYDTVYVSNAIFGSIPVALYYECSQCSVMFTDPQKFTDVKQMTKHPNGHVKTKPEIPAGIPHGYQPTSDNLDRSNPPQNGSSVPNHKAAVTCPVCCGTGHVDAGFYLQTQGSSSAGGTEPCRSCSGKGYVIV